MCRTLVIVSWQRAYNRIKDGIEKKLRERIFANALRKITPYLFYSRKHLSSAKVTSPERAPTTATVHH